MKRKFFGLVSVCLALVMTLSMASFVWAEPRMTPKMVTAEEPTCSNETVFLKGLILTTILEEETSLDVSDFSLTADEAEEVLLEVVNENPGSLSKLSGYSISDDESGLVIHFEYEEPTVFLFSTKAYSAEVEQEKRRILNCVEEGMSDVEKALVVHDYMALNYEYDTTYSIYSAEGMFENKTGVCQAYALAFKEIMEELDIPCQIVTSHAMNHAWNLVMIDGEWYHVDITWDDPIPDMLGRARHIFFLLSDDAISDAGYYMRPHHSWTAKNVADSDRYDGYFWYDVESAIITTQGNFYYIKYDYNESDYGRIIQRNVSSGRESVLYEIDTVWNVWNDSYGYWIGCYSGLGLYNGRLYFNTPERIKSVTLSGTNVKTVYTPNTSTGYLYGFAMNDTIITYGLATSPNDDLTNTGKCTISGTAVVDVSGVSLNQASAHLLIGESFTLQATVKPSDASNKKVYWSSSNTKVATVENGVVVAKDAGKAIITVETEDGGYAAYCRVTVTPDLRVMIEGDRVVAQGKYISLKATAYYEKDGEIIKTTDAIGWRSSNESVLTVSKGKVTGVGAGSAVITAYVIGTDIEASMEIEVVAPVTSLKFASSKMTAYVGNRFSLFYELNTVPSEHTDIIEWTSSNEAVARVNQYGVVTPLATGTAKITAKAVAGKKTATCTVTVAREPEGIMIEGDSAVAQGKTITLKAYAYYMENGKVVKTKDAISWESSDESVATISKGKVKGIAAGTAVITAYIAGTDIEETFYVDVAVPVKTLKLAMTKATCYVGNVLDLAEGMTVAPFDNTDTILWSSSDEDVAIVDENTGEVTIVGIGKVKITATAVAGKKKATCSITVNPEPEEIILTGDRAVAKGKTITLKAAAYYYDEVKGKQVKTKDTISWMSSDESVATVTKGKVKGIDAGTVIITAYIEGTDLFVEYEVTVAIPAKSVKLSVKKLSAAIGDTFDLAEYLTVSPEDNTDEIVWTTSKSSVAEVDEYGYVTIVGKGTAKITAKAVAGKKSASVTITVK